MTTEQVVLLSDAGEAIGTADKATVHHQDTPLHLAFSVYLFDQLDGPDPQLLLTRRALAKITWPGVWTNSCCGHPAPDETVEQAVRRRTRQELGIDITDLRLALPDFRYRAVMDDGVVENEICPVYVGVVSGDVHPDPTEVDSVAWVPWAPFRASVLNGGYDVSPWCREQVPALPADPAGAPTIEASTTTTPT